MLSSKRLVKYPIREVFNNNILDNLADVLKLNSLTFLLSGLAGCVDTIHRKQKDSRIIKLKLVKLQLILSQVAIPRT